MLSVEPSAGLKLTTPDHELSQDQESNTRARSHPGATRVKEFSLTRVVKTVRNNKESNSIFKESGMCFWLRKGLRYREALFVKGEKK